MSKTLCTLLRKSFVVIKKQTGNFYTDYTSQANKSSKPYIMKKHILRKRLLKISKVHSTNKNSLCCLKLHMIWHQPFLNTTSVPKVCVLLPTSVKLECPYPPPSSLVASLCHTLAYMIK